ASRSWSSPKVGRDHGGVPVERPIRDALLRLVVDPDQTAALRVALGPLEVVHQRPGVVAAYVGAVANGRLDGPQVRVEVVDPRLVVDHSVLIRTHDERAHHTGDTPP